MSRSLRGAFALLWCCLFGVACAPPPSPAAPPSPPAVTVDVAAAPPPAGAPRGAERAAKGAAPGEGFAGGQGAARDDADPEADEGGVMGGVIGGVPGGGAPVAGARGRAIAPAAAPAAIPTNPADGPIPVTAADPQRGDRDALVTVVEFADFECPFCRKVSVTLAQLEAKYGPSQLRVVWKNNPLPFHGKARPIAQVAMALFAQSGNAAFWQAHDALYGNQADLSTVADQQRANAGITDAQLQKLIGSGQLDAKIDGDMALGRAIGVQGTPAFFINGVFVSGAQPIDKFEALIDEQIRVAKAAFAAGTPANKIYVKLAKEQWVKPEARPSTSTPPAPEDKSVWKVSVGTSPVRGKATALVTIVEFADFQCPFCSRVEPTLAQVLLHYGDKVRLVWKNNALPFHPRAEPAAELALEARAQKGDAGFWAVHDALFANQMKLDDAGLSAIAIAAGLDAPKAMGALASRKHAAKITADEELADDVQATGTPHFFINGRRLVGAQPLEKFKAVIDEELAKAEALVKAGTPAARVYDKLQVGGKTAPPPEKKAKFPAATAKNPSRGPANAKVVVQFLGDFQCPFTKRVLDTIEALEKELPGQVRVVWRNLPLPMHKDAIPAAEAAMEAFQQKGASGFWAMHALLFKSQGQPDAFTRASLDGYAASLGLDMIKFTAALDAHTHMPEIQADMDLANDSGISGTPAFVINGYFVSGAQPIAKFVKVARFAMTGK